jgi:hypothetical protein
MFGGHCGFSGVRQICNGHVIKRPGMEMGAKSIPKILNFKALPPKFRVETSLGSIGTQKRLQSDRDCVFSALEGRWGRLYG